MTKFNIDMQLQNYGTTVPKTHDNLKYNYCTGVLAYI